MSDLVYDPADSALKWSGAIADVSGTAGGVYTATEQAILNDLVQQVNAILAALRTGRRIVE